MNGNTPPSDHSLASLAPQSESLPPKPAASTHSYPDAFTQKLGPESPDVSAVFGTPYRVGATTIIPVASVHTLRHASRAEPLHTQASPIAIIEISDSLVRVRPVRSTRMLLLTWVLVLVWTLYWLLRARPRR